MIFILGLAAIGISFYFHKLFLERLKGSHAELYQTFGEPTTFTKYPIHTALMIRDLSPKEELTNYTDFMASRAWQKLNDDVLVQYANYRKYAIFVAIGLCIVSFIK